MINEIALSGCTPGPLMSYLKALGVLRLVSEQKDSAACGSWEADIFRLRTSLDNKELLAFFVDQYAPTPIVAPWSGGSGFFKKDNKEFVNALSNCVQLRCKPYAEVIGLARKIIGSEKLEDKPSDSLKARLLQRYRRELPEPVVEWIDAAMVLRANGQVFAPLLGTGGNDGRLDFAQNFMGRLVTLGIVHGKPHPQSENWLRCALFGNTIDGLQKAAVGQFAPGRSGGANATQGMEGDATDNPWDFVLMLEGSLVLAGAAVRRLAAGEDSRSAFPFTVRPTAAGYGSASDQDAVSSRGEIWLPLWSHPTTLCEIRTLFAEGRATVSDTPARTGIDFARAVATLGVDRGLDHFSRYGFLKRSGKAYLASPLARFQVHERMDVDLLREIDPWLDAFRRGADDKDSPPRFKAALRRIDEAVFEACRYGGPRRFAEILCALGNAERQCSNAERWRTERRLPPLTGLSTEWIAATNDGTLEFELALALAGIRDAEEKIAPLRANLEPVSLCIRKGGGSFTTWAEKDRSVVWNSADLGTNLAAVLERRIIDGERTGCVNMPLAFRQGASIRAIATFLAGTVDEARVAELLWGLVLVAQDKAYSEIRFAELEVVPLPRAYALLKLLFLPKPLLIGSVVGSERRVRFARMQETGIRIVPEARVLALLRAGRLDEACRIAAWRLRASGLAPMPIDWEDVGSTDGLRLAAALLMPIREGSLQTLLNLVTRSETTAKAVVA